MKIKEIGFVGIPVTDMTTSPRVLRGSAWSKVSDEMMGGKWIEYPVGDDTLAIANVGDELDAIGSRHRRSAGGGKLRRSDRAVEKSRCPFCRRAVETPCCHMAVVQDPDGNKLIIHKLKPENEKGVCK